MLNKRWVQLALIGLALLLAFALGQASGRRGGLHVLLKQALQAPNSAFMPVAQVQRLDRLSQFSALPVTATQMMLLGDSLIHEGEWSEWLGAGVINRGIRGETTVDLLERLPQTLAQGCPGQLYILVGTNDLRRQPADSPPEAVAQTIGQAHAQLLAQLHQHCPASRLWVQALLPMNCPLFLQVFGESCPAQFEKMWRLTNEQLARQAQRAGANFVDINASLTQAGQLNPQLTHDGLHLNGMGYQIWGQQLRRYLLS